MISIRALGLSVGCITLMFGLSACGGSSSEATPSKVTPIATKPTNSCAGEGTPQGASCITVQDRDSVVYKPTGDIKGVALFLHGAPGHPNKVMKLFDGEMLSQKESWLSAAPEGIGGTWGWASLNDASANNNQDVEFISHLLDELRAQYNISSSKVYIFGYSAGGFMGYKLACQIPEKLTAVISLAGQFRGDFEQCTTSTSVALHHFHSPSDRDVPMSGRSNGDISTLDDTLKHWRIINACDEQFTDVDHPGVTVTSSASITTQWSNCIKPVRFTKMLNVNHEDQYQAEVLYDIYKDLL
jgi:polyhydroxybutyrate depolymerase